MNHLNVLLLALSPVPLVQDAAQAPRAPSEIVRLRFAPTANLILVDVRVAQSDALTFVLDSGASNAVIDRAVAEELGIEASYSQSRGTETGRAALDYGLAASVPFHLGEYSVDLKQVVIAPCSDLARMMIGTEVAGILGHTFLAGHTVEVDYESGELVVHDPATYRYEGAGEALPLTFRRSRANLPFTPVTVVAENGEERVVDMLVDSAGSIMGTLGLHDPDALAVVVAEDATRLPALGATGLGNNSKDVMFETFVTRLHQVRIGPFPIDGPTSTCKSGRQAGIDLFGAQALRRFHVVFDYRRSRLILEPNSSFSNPTAYDRSGMTLVAAEDDTRVRRVAFVVPGGPADQAGLQPDDVLLEIDGRAADALPLHATRLAFYELGEFQLELRRAGEVFQATLKTRDLL